MNNPTEEVHKDQLIESTIEFIHSGMCGAGDLAPIISYLAKLDDKESENKSLDSIIEHE